MVWVVCGAGRRVGKTAVAQAIADALERSVYCKCGHRGRKAGKPENFFVGVDDLLEFIAGANEKYEHVIVESNALMYLAGADVSIYIDGVEGVTDFREDAKELCEKADITVCSGSAAGDWEKVLATIITDKKKVGAVCDCLSRQRRYLFGPAANVRSKVWFEAGGSHVFGKGLAGLLENVDRVGTLQGAAAESSMSYRHAWDMIRAAEERLGRSLIERQVGGVGGGGSRLSGQGRKMLESFRAINKDVAAYADERFRQLLDKGNGNG